MFIQGKNCGLRSLEESDKKNSLLFGIIHHREHVGNIMIYKIDSLHRKAENSIMIGETPPLFFLDGDHVDACR